MLADCTTFQRGLPFALVLPSPRLPERLLLAVQGLHQYMPANSYRGLDVPCGGSCRNRFVPVPVLGTEFRFHRPWGLTQAGAIGGRGQEGVYSAYSRRLLDLRMTVL